MLQLQLLVVICDCKGFVLILVNLPLVLGMHISSILQQIFHYCNSVVTSSKMKWGAVSSFKISAVYSQGCTYSDFYGGTQSSFYSTIHD